MCQKIYRFGAVLLLAFLPACSFIPAYQQPAMPVAATFSGPATATVDQAATTTADIGWRDYFTDPALQQLITTALANNRDLRQSALNIEAYQAQYRIQQAARLPAINGNATGLKQRTSSGGTHTTLESYSATVGMTAYELDFFGRVKSLTEDALEQYLAMAESHRSVQLSLVAEVARAYLTLLADQELLAITAETLRSEEDSFRLIGERTEQGVATQLALAQARTSLETARSNLAAYRRQVALDRNNLVLLTGAPGQVAPPAASLLSAWQGMPALAAPISSVVLLQRPDIQAAEHELKGDNANIGAARAAFFPTISLTANAGVMSSDLNDLFAGSPGVWMFSPSISLPIFTAGRLDAQLDVAKIRKEVSIAKYEKTIQTAFREVADALDAQATYGEQLSAQQANLAANRDYSAIARQRYDEGLDSYLTLLDAQRSLYAARQTYISTRLAKLINQVNLYKALGGGWKE